VDGKTIDLVLHPIGVGLTLNDAAGDTAIASFCWSTAALSCSHVSFPIPSTKAGEAAHRRT